MAKRTVVKGKDLMLFVNGKAIALATTCNLDLTANTEDAASKDSGGWDNPQITGWAWTAGSENLNGANDATSIDLVYKDLMDLCLAGTPVDVKFGIAANAANTDVPEAGWTIPTAGYKGTGIIDSVKCTAANKQNSTNSISIKGQGALTAIAS